MTTSIGITTGIAYCGITGSQSSREYTVLGDVVNTASRLMQYSHRGIMVDSGTLAEVCAILSYIVKRYIILLSGQ